MKFEFARPTPLTNTRYIALTEPLQEATASAVRERLAAVEGIKWLELSVGGKSLRLAYDTALLGYHQVVQELGQAGAIPDHGRLSRWRGAWYDFVDDNTRGNAAANAACCSKPPPGARGPKR